MTRRFYQSESGNITIVELDNTLLIFMGVDDSFLVINPSNPGVFSSEVEDVDISEKATPEEIREMIRSKTGK